MQNPLNYFSGFLCLKRAYAVPFWNSLPRKKEIMRILESYTTESFHFGDSFIRMTFMASEPVFDKSRIIVDDIIQNTTQKIVELLLKNPYLTRKNLRQSKQKRY